MIFDDYQAKGATIYVVYDSDDAVACAENIASYVQERRSDMQVHVIPAAEFRESMLEDDKVIIVGSGELSAHYALQREIPFRQWGIMIAWNWRADALQKKLLVLRATKIPADQKKVSEAEFIRYYNMIASKQRELAVRYHIPTEFGTRNSFRDCQYDLLFLDGYCYMDSLVDKPQPEKDREVEPEWIDNKIRILLEMKKSPRRTNDDLERIDQKVRALRLLKKRMCSNREEL